MNVVPDRRAFRLVLAVSLAAAAAADTAPAAGVATKPAATKPAAVAAAPPAKAVDPRALVRTAFDKSADPGARRDAVTAIGRLGPAAKPFVPQLCRLLVPTPADPSPPASEAKDALKAVGPDGAAAAVAAARADVMAQRPGERPVALWLTLLAELAPAQTLIDGVADKNALWAETCALALEGQLAAYASPATLPATAPSAAPAAATAVRAALEKAGPKLAAGWTRAATATAPPPPDPRRTAAAAQAQAQAREAALVPDAPWAERRGRWMAAVAAAANAGGPAALKPVEEAAAAHAKAGKADPAADTTATAAAAAVAEYARLLRQPKAGPGMPTPGADAAVAKLRAFGAAAVVPLAELMADDHVRPAVMVTFVSVVAAEPHSAQADPARVRERLLAGKPPAPRPLDAKAQAALTKVMPAVLRSADQASPGGGTHPHAAAARTLLNVVAADVPAAADALIARLPTATDASVGPIAAALAACDAATRAKLETAAAAADATAPVKEIALRVQLAQMPPKQAAQELLAKVPAPADRSRLVQSLDAPAAGWVEALMVELLADPASGADELLKRRVESATTLPAAMAAALDRPEPAVRRGVLNAWPARALTPAVSAKAAALIDDPDPTVADAAVGVLARAGATAVPALAGATKSPAAATRVRAARALADVAAARSDGGPPAADPAAVAQVVEPLLADADVTVAGAALQTIGRLPGRAEPVLTGRLKAAATPAQRDQLAQGLVEAAAGRLQPASELTHLFRQNQQAAAAAKSTDPTARRPSIQTVPPGQRPGFVVAGLAAGDDPAVAAAAAEVLMRADVIVNDRTARPPPAPTAEQAAWLAAIKAADPAARAAALAQPPPECNFAGAADALMAALSDPDATVRALATRPFLSAASRPDGRVPLGVYPGYARLVEMATEDPAPGVRESAAYAFDPDRGGRLGPQASRLYVLAASDQPSDRALAAVLFGKVLPDPFEIVPTRRTPRVVRALEKLLADPTPAVREAAAAAVPKHVSPEGPPGPAADVVVRLLAKPADLGTQAKAALVGVVPLLAARGVKGLSDSGDADVRTAAQLGLEQAPPVSRGADPAVSPAHRVPVAVAAAGLASPSPHVRQLAARSLLTPDPADPARLPAGTQALLAAADDPRPAVHVNALDALAAGYCGPRIGSGETEWRKTTMGEVGQLPTRQEVALAQLLKQCSTGPTAGRVAAVNKFGAGDPAMLAARWDGFVYLLEDPDPQVRAAALNVARAQVKVGVPAAVGAGKPPVVRLRRLP